MCIPQKPQESSIRTSQSHANEIIEEGGLSLRPNSRFLWFLRYKRWLDVSFSLLVLTVGAPLFLIIALTIKITSKGSIFYTSIRVGKQGCFFKCWKFRTMFEDADQRLHQLLQQNPTYIQEWNTYFKLKNDSRVTWVGKFLRRTSLDELPQFWNVLIGDLSLVGPRPFLPSELSEVRRWLVTDANAQLLFCIRPGITGLWQTSGRSELPFASRVHLDLEYVRRRSFLFDLKLIGKTIPMLIWPKGAF